MGIIWNDEPNKLLPTMEKYKGLYVPPGNKTLCQSYSCNQIKCEQCIFSNINQETLKEYLRNSINN